MFQVITGNVRISGGVRLAREAQQNVSATNTVTVTAMNTVLATITVPANKVYHLSEVSTGGETANRIDVLINGQLVQTFFYAANTTQHKTYAAMPKAMGGQTIEVISRQATSGTHTAMIIAHEGPILS